MDFSEAILYVGLAQSLFAAFALGTRRTVSLPDKLLVGSLLLFAFKFIILIFHLEHQEFFDMQFSLGLIPLTFSPILYLYTYYLVSERKKFRALDLLHFLPFVLITLAYFIFFQDVVDFSDESFLRQDPYLWVRVTFSIVFFTSVIVYTVLTFAKLIVFRRNIEAQFSYRDGDLQLFWVNFIAVLFTLSGLVVIVAGAYNAIMFKRVVDTALLSHIGLTSVAYAISYFGLRQPSLFRSEYATEQKPPPQKPAAKTEPESKEVKPRFTDQEAKALIERLIIHMSEERPYLNPELTLSDLSAQINLAKHELTDLLNVHMEMNFFTFVNDFRLKAVIRRLANPDYDHLTIMAIANDCGFNSKSTFNSLFKQTYEHTPSDYKKMLRDGSAVIS
ncbi:MAG: helix-turn-helix transcriptional regulator [Flavobacteriales bacterium]|nr:helix-turn-helix transcriptional regulator [Flavobacteriales bacterium]